MEVDQESDAKISELFQTANKLHAQLKAEWYGKSPNLTKCGDLLTQLKIIMMKLSLLHTGSKASTEEMLLAVNFLEIGVEWSIAKQDITSFERFMSQLKCYYLDYQNEVPESSKMYCMLGLNLLFLLSQNRVAEFHMELELISPDKIHNNPFIKHAVVLEQYLMEGCYHKIFLAAHIAPAATYHFFMNILLETVRNEIAECLESAYTEISVLDVMKLLNLTDKMQVVSFADRRKWKLSQDGRFLFAAYQEKLDSVKVEIPHFPEIIKNMLQYAKEMETII